MAACRLLQKRIKRLRHDYAGCGVHDTSMDRHVLHRKKVKAACSTGERKGKTAAPTRVEGDPTDGGVGLLAFVRKVRVHGTVPNQQENRASDRIRNEGIRLQNGMEISLVVAARKKNAPVGKDWLGEVPVVHVLARGQKAFCAQPCLVDVADCINAFHTGPA